MRIINDDRIVLTHYGVKGMRWGIRKERETKGRNIVKKYKNSATINKRDLQDAQWMSWGVGGKTAASLYGAAFSAIMRMTFKGKLPSNPAEIKKLFINLAKDAAIIAVRNEISGRGALNRYTQSGAKDTSKKQYNRNRITPNRLLAGVVATGLYVAPTMVKVGRYSYKAVKANRGSNEAKVSKWAQSETVRQKIYDDGYMSIFEKKD